MKLNKDNKYAIEVGDQLKFSESAIYTVTTILPCRTGVNFTLRDIKTGQTIYSHPSSQCYGAEVIKADGACPDINKAYLRQQAKVDDLLMAAMHTLNCIDAFREGEDTWSDVAEMSRYLEPLTEIVVGLKRYAARRGVDL